jgi:hypothetical protein
VEVFLSSTKADLVDYRNRVYEVIKGAHNVTRMEDFPSAAEPSLEFCLGCAESAEAVVLLIGYRYGSLAPGTGLSYTEAEYERAKDEGVPVLPYVR